MKSTTGEFIRHAPCPSCGSKDNLAVYTDHSYCFGCEYYEPDGRSVEISSSESKSIFPLPSKAMPGIDHRGLTDDTVNKYRVSVSRKPDSNIEAVFPRFNDSGEHVANQIRYKEKGFSFEGRLGEAVLFGRDVWPEGSGKAITITEGYYDALSAFQLTGSRYPSVAVTSASSAKKEAVANFEYLDSFPSIVVNFDADEPGQKAAKEVAGLFAPGKVRILALQKGKDASDYAQAGDSSYVKEWYNAPTFMPDGLKLGSDLREDIRNHKTPKSVPYPWDGLNHKTYGMRQSELVLLLADTGVGKTSVCKGIEYSLLTNPQLIEENVGVGFMHLEEPKYDTAIGLMSIHARKPFHLPDTVKTEEELMDAYDAVINTNRVVIWDHFGSNDIDVVLAKIRHMAALGCKYIVVDHLSIIVSDQSGDERKQLDEISTKIKTLTMNLDIAVLCVMHINRKGEARGSAGPEQVANVVMRLERDKKSSNDWRRNVLKITVEKNRFCGRTGPAAYLFFDENTNTFEELTPDMIDVYETGGSDAGREFEMYGR